MRHAIAGHAVNTTYTDVGSADIAGANICLSIHGHKKSAKYAVKPRIISHYRFNAKSRKLFYEDLFHLVVLLLVSSMLFRGNSEKCLF